MKKLHLIACIFAFMSLLLPVSAVSQSNTLSRSEINKIFIGHHMCALQWISWEKFGTAEFYYEGNKIRCTGGQESDVNDDYLYFDGYVTIIDSRHFIFNGEIITCIYHINNGDPVRRSGKMHFEATGKRKYWRLQEMSNPKDEVVDYVDIFFK